MRFYDEYIGEYHVEIVPGEDRGAVLRITSKNLRYPIEVKLSEAKTAKLKMSIADLLDFQRKPVYEYYLQE